MIQKKKILKSILSSISTFDLDNLHHFLFQMQFIIRIHFFKNEIIPHSRKTQFPLNKCLWGLILFLSLNSCQKHYEFQLIGMPELNSSVTIAQAEITDFDQIENYQLMYKGAVLLFQITGNKIYWKVSSENYKGPFQWMPSNKLPEKNHFFLTAKKEFGQHSIYLRDQKIIGYQMDTIEVPEDVNPAYRRSGFIHPLNTPSGKRLTQIQPKDHFHHYGLWNPWTHTLFEGDTLDFWNLDKKEGTVRFAEMLSEDTGAIFSEFEVLHQHVVIKEGKNKIALNEKQKIRITPIAGDRFFLDFEIKYYPHTYSSFKIIEYRYGGFGWRTTEEWDNKNSRVLSSEGKTRKDADGSLARWCIVDGKLGEGYGGAVMLSHPQNYNHPEPLRIWPEDQYGRGDLFANFATTKNTDWIMVPKTTYTLRYRMLVYDGKITPEEAENNWVLYTQPLTYQLK